MAMLGNSTVKYKPSSKGAKQLLNSPAMIAGINSCVQNIKANAFSGTSGSGAVFIADTRPGKTRAHGVVKTANAEAARLNAKNNTLLKALGSGRV